MSKERNMFVGDRYIFGLIRVYGKEPVSTECGTWYPQACRFLKLANCIHSPNEKDLIESTMQYIRTEQRDLMTVFHSGKQSATFIILKTGSLYL